MFNISGKAGQEKSVKDMSNTMLMEYQDCISIQLPKDILAIPSMMSPNERKFLYGLTKNHYSGEGIIIDAGIFMGASSYIFGKAIQENQKFSNLKFDNQKPIMSFDRAVIYPNFFPFAQRHNIETTGLAAGDSFKHLIEENIAPVENVVDLKIGDIIQEDYSKVGLPIEILFLDIIKRPDINNYTLKSWFPYLIPGKSIVIQQDFFCEGVPHIPVTMEYFDEYFDYLGEIHSASIYRYKKEIPLEELEKDLGETLPIEQQLELIDNAKLKTNFTSRKYVLDITKVMLAKTVVGNDSEIAKSLLSEVENQYPDLVDENKSSARLFRAYRSAKSAVSAFT